MEALKVPAKLAAKRETPLAVLMLISSHRITRRKQLIPKASHLMGRNSVEIWQKYFDVFKENNLRKRQSFFSDPLIQFLWSKFKMDFRMELIEKLATICDSQVNDAKMFFIEI